jgi:hypothetical protein
MDWKRFFKKTMVLVFLFSVAVHLLLLIGFGGTTLFKGRIVKMPFTAERIPADKIIEAVAPPTDEPPSQESSNTEVMPQEQVASTESSAPLPEVLSIPQGATWTPTPSREIKVPGAGSVGERGTGLSGVGATGTRLAKSSSFFGIKIDQATPRIILLLDTSNTMFKRRRGKETYTYDYGVVKKEAIDLIKSLEETAQFNVVLYEGGAVAFQKNSIPLSDEFKDQASKWIEDIDENPSRQIQDRKGGDTLLEGGGTRLDTGLKLAFRYDPTTIFLLTDGEANMQAEKGAKKLKEEDILPLIKQLQEKQKTRAVIHVVHYLTNEAQESETDLLKAIANQGRGKVKVVEAKIRQTETSGGLKGDGKSKTKN